MKVITERDTKLTKVTIGLNQDGRVYLDFIDKPNGLCDTKEISIYQAKSIVKGKIEPFKYLKNPTVKIGKNIKLEVSRADKVKILSMLDEIKVLRKEGILI